MKDGLVFIWVEKEYISKLIKCFEAQDFFYVENMCYVMLDQKKKEDIDCTRQTNIDDSYVLEKSNFLRKSKKTLLIFRRMSNKKSDLHTRTPALENMWRLLRLGHQLGQGKRRVRHEEAALKIIEFRSQTKQRNAKHTRVVREDQQWQHCPKRSVQTKQLRLQNDWDHVAKGHGWRRKEGNPPPRTVGAWRQTTERLG